MSSTANTILRDILIDMEITLCAIKVASNKQLLAEVVDAIDAAYVAGILPLTPDDWGKISAAVMQRGTQIDNENGADPQAPVPTDDVSFTSSGRLKEYKPAGYTIPRELVPHYMRIPQQRAQRVSKHSQLLTLLAFARRLGLTDAADHIQLTTDR